MPTKTPKPEPQPEAPRYVHVRMPAEFHRQLVQIAKSERNGISAVARRLISLALERGDHEAA